jgi:hypothetical protein
MSRCRAIHLIIAELDEAADRGASLTTYLRSRLAALRQLGAMALGVLRVGLDLMTAPAAPDDQPMPVAEPTQLAVAYNSEPEPVGSRRATPTSHFEKRPGTISG